MTMGGGDVTGDAMERETGLEGENIEAEQLAKALEPPTFEGHR